MISLTTFAVVIAAGLLFGVAVRAAEMHMQREQAEEAARRRNF